jgi:hypothetical protein
MRFKTVKAKVPASGRLFRSDQEHNSDMLNDETKPREIQARVQSMQDRLKVLSTELKALRDQRHQIFAQTYR